MYQGQIDTDDLIILERYAEAHTPLIDIPEDCLSLFPKHLYNHETDNRIYAVFNEIEGISLYETRFKSWEPDLIDLICKLVASLTELYKSRISLSEISLKDIFMTADGNLVFLIFPRENEPEAEPDEIISDIVKNIFYHKVDPNLTRNLEDPLLSFALSEEFRKMIRSFIDGDIRTEAFLSELKRLASLSPDWDIYAKTDVGQERDHNEDACGWMSGFLDTYTDSHVYTALAVADGMGGHQKGEVASRYTLYEWMKHISEGFLVRADKDFSNLTLQSFLEQTFEETTRKFLAHEDFKDIPAKMRPGATLVGAVVVDRLAFVGNSGDSRAYLIYDDTIERITTDHSFIQILIDRGDITEEEAFTHDQSNVITSFIGIEPKQFKRDVYIRYLKKGRRFFSVLTDFPGC